MPLLTRIGAAPGTNFTREQALGIPVGNLPRYRPTLEVVTFLPFPAVGASQAERFKPEFFVSLGISVKDAQPEDMYSAVACYQGRMIQQISYGPGVNQIGIFYDTRTQTCFSAEMLMGLSKEELAATAADAGELDIYVIRARKGEKKPIIIPKIYNFEDFSTPGIEEPAKKSYDFGGSSSGGSRSFELPPTRSFELPQTRGFDYGGATRGMGGFSPTLHSGGSYRPPRPTPQAAPKQVGEVRLGAGTRGEEVETQSVSGYKYDSSFGIQPVKIRFLGVREGSSDAATEILRDMGRN
jgi:hypothetical protein